MSSVSAVHISGSKTAEDWRAFRTRLVPGDAALWKAAFEQYFYKRLSLRYLNPIRVLQEHGTFQGEGFSIVAIQCSLIEFLETTLTGQSYRYLRKGEHLGPYEYSSSSAVFVGFLCGRDPFKRVFSAAAAAQDFYIGVRCGLLHEARTKHGWKIWAESPEARIVDLGHKIVYRNNFQSALEGFIAAYRRDLPVCADLQEAFIRKFDSLCD